MPKEASGYSGLHERRRRSNNRDIAETHIDPWVFDKVEPNVEWAPLMPRKPEPKVNRYWIDDYKVNEPSKFYIDGSSPTDTYYEESIPQG